MARKQRPTARRRRDPDMRRRSPLVLILLLLLICSIIMGATASLALSPPAAGSKSIDPIPEERQFAAQLYREQCGSCHLALPPEVLPTESWRQLLMNPDDHYGVSLDLITPEILLMWGYLRDFSRPTTEGEAEPYRVADSRYFQALHPRVDFEGSPDLESCNTCHNRAREFDFRSLTPAWADAP